MRPPFSSCAETARFHEPGLLFGEQSLAVVGWFVDLDGSTATA
jgi:hypothetical protein